jgi:homoserine dehydrogenase
MLVRMALIGFGNVGQEFARMLLERREWLQNAASLDVRIVAIATRSHGSLIRRDGLDLDRVLSSLERTGRLGPEGECVDAGPMAIVDDSGADIVVELTTLNIENGQPAVNHISESLLHGKHVITANKGPIAFAYRTLSSLAKSNGLEFRFEGTVMDGTPVFNLVERTLPGCQVLSIRGILNSTSNFVIDEMCKGSTRDAAIAEAQRLGFAEADPSLDIDGWDAATKITALANVLMGAGANPRSVSRRGIGDLASDDLMSSVDRGFKIRLVAEARRTADGIELSVAPEEISPDDLFWPVDGTSSAITLETDLMGKLTLFETDPVITQTAYAVFSDMLTIAETIRRCCVSGPTTLQG